MDNSVVLYLIIAIAVVSGLVYRMINSRKNKSTRRIPNYRAFFFIGIAWIPIGVVTDNIGLWGMGLAFLIAGIVNKDKWGKETRWSELSPGEKKMKLWFIGGLTLLLITAILFFKNSG